MHDRGGVKDRTRDRVRVRLRDRDDDILASCYNISNLEPENLLQNLKPLLINSHKISHKISNLDPHLVK